MESYLCWDQKTVSEVDDTTFAYWYEKGYLATRVGRGILQQTRSIRIDLSVFRLSSENRRVLSKNNNRTCAFHPIPYELYHWRIHKMGKEFYEKKFGKNTFSAQKIKELFTTADTNFNGVLRYTSDKDTEATGYCIVRVTPTFLHYAYPFYDPARKESTLGMGMMLQAILLAQKEKKQYVYLGSAQRTSDTYKLQFNGLEWFDGNCWQTNVDELKKVLLHV